MGAYCFLPLHASKYRGQLKLFDERAMILCLVVGSERLGRGGVAKLQFIKRCPNFGTDVASLPSLACGSFELVAHRPWMCVFIHVDTMLLKNPRNFLLLFC